MTDDQTPEQPGKARARIARSRGRSPSQREGHRLGQGPRGRRHYRGNRRDPRIQEPLVALRAQRRGEADNRRRGREPYQEQIRRGAASARERARPKFGSRSRADSDEIAVLAAGMRAEGGCPPPNPPQECSRQPHRRRRWTSRPLVETVGMAIHVAPAQVQRRGDAGITQARGQMFAARSARCARPSRASSPPPLPSRPGRRCSGSGRGTP